MNESPLKSSSDEECFFHDRAANEDKEEYVK